MWRVGVTGTQHGLTPEQLATGKMLLAGLINGKDHRQSTIFSHGDCIGADVQLANIAMAYGYYVQAFPPIDPKKRAFHKSHRILGSLPYLKRNHLIVNHSSILLAFPRQHKEQRRSGTWATIRYALKNSTDLIIVFPDGSPELHLGKS